MNIYISKEVIISAEIYAEMIDWCFKYSTCFSIRIKTPFEQDLQKLIDAFAPYIIAKRQSIMKPNYYKCFDEPSNDGRSVIFLFRCCSESKQLVLSHAQKLFSSDCNLFFYRSSTEVFLSAAIEEEDILCAAKCERIEFDNLASKDIWNYTNENIWRPANKDFDIAYLDEIFVFDYHQF